MNLPRHGSHGHQGPRQGSGCGSGGSRETEKKEEEKARDRDRRKWEERRMDKRGEGRKQRKTKRRAMGQRDERSTEWCRGTIGFNNQKYILLSSSSAIVVVLLLHSACFYCYYPLIVALPSCSFRLLFLAPLLLFSLLSIPYFCFLAVPLSATLQGVLAFDTLSSSSSPPSSSAALGFWLIHSVPLFPPPASQARYGFDASQSLFGQSFLCVSLGLLCTCMHSASFLSVSLYSFQQLILSSGLSCFFLRPYIICLLCTFTHSSPLPSSHLSASFCENKEDHLA